MESEGEDSQGARTPASGGSFYPNRTRALLGDYSDSRGSWTREKLTVAEGAMR